MVGKKITNQQKWENILILYSNKLVNVMTIAYALKHIKRWERKLYGVHMSLWESF